MKPSPYTNHGCAIYCGNAQIATTFICDTGEAIPSDFDIDLAAEIARKLESHQALIDALQEAVEQISYLHGCMLDRDQQFTAHSTRAALDQARAAIALAQEGAR